MLRRTLCWFLSATMLWLSLATQEAVPGVAPAAVDALAAWTTAEWPGDPHDGSVADHHLDDQPVQTGIEPPLEQSAGLGRPVCSALLARPAGRLPPADARPTVQPYLGPLLRPPIA